MNYTYYYSCDEECGYRQVAHIHTNEKVYQCMSCFNIEGKESQDDFALKCQVCGKSETIYGDVMFNEEKTCENCHMTGKIGFTENEQFLLIQEISVLPACTRCYKPGLQELIEEATCPMCYKPLQAELSAFWEDED